MAEPKRKFDRAEFVRDLRSGFGDSELTLKYSMSPKLLYALFDHLLEAGVLAESDLRYRKMALGAGDQPFSGPGPDEKVDGQPRQDHGAAGQSARSVLPRSEKGNLGQILADLGEIDIHQEIVPIDASNFSELRKDFVFWSVSGLGVIPLIVVNASNPDVQIIGFTIFFAVFWGVIFKKLVVNDNHGWKLPIYSLLFTGSVGILGLLVLYAFLPSFYMDLAHSKNNLILLFGFVFQVGLWEELFKMIPALFYLAWVQRKGLLIEPKLAIVIGVFSGLGFAMTENLGYIHQIVARTVGLGNEFGSLGFSYGIKGAVASVLLRSLSCMFCHAVWSGIFAYFLTVSFITKKRTAALFLIGLTITASLHGLYDWFCSLEVSLAAVTAGFSFMLFYAYISKSRWKIYLTDDYAA